jgi:hypothetical protein
MKFSAWMFGVLYALLIIAFKVSLFQSNAMFLPLGRMSNIIMYLGISVFIALALFFAKKEANIGEFGLKQGVKSGLMVTAVFCIIYSIFNYFFFKYQLVDMFLEANKASIIKEGKTMDQARALFSPFFQVTAEVFGIIGFGGLGSVLMAMLFGRK